MSHALSAPTLCLLRPSLHGALLDALGPSALELGREAAGFEPHADGVRLVLADGARIDCDVLIGADGVGSTIRARLHEHEARARASAFGAFRGVAHGARAELGGVGGMQLLGSRCEGGAALADHDTVYWYLSVRNPPALSERPSAEDVRAALGPLIDFGRPPLEGFGT